MADTSWIAALRDADVATEGLRWLQEDEGRALRDAWAAEWRVARFDPAFVAQGLERIERSTPLLVGPTRRRRLSQREATLVVVHDPAEPDVPWLSLATTMPPQAWADAAPDRAGLGRSIAADVYAADREPAELDGTLVVVKQLEIDGIDLIQRTTEVLEPWMDDAFWGGASTGDPYAHLAPDAGTFLLRVVMERAAAQHPGRVTQLSVRSLWSRSILTIEQHPYGFWRFVVRYTPQCNRRAMVRLTSDQPGTRLPADLPVDVACSLMRGGALTREGIGRDWSTASAGDLLALWLLEGDEPATLGVFRTLLEAWRGSDRHVDLVNVARAVGLDALLSEVALAEGTSELGDGIRNVLRPRGTDDEGTVDDDEAEGHS